MIGQTLGHYRIIEKIGAGGMGVVFRAHDDRLDRDVAIKVLPAGTLADEAARKRFRKEALALAKLNHPNIETLHDFDTEQGVDFLVMEYIPGQTLAGRLVGGALPEKEVAVLGAQIAAALGEAHEQGVVHRDLKPGNVLVTPKGQVKVLDFGLAKLLPPEGAAARVEATTESLTVGHEAPGTLPYMAPEQLRGDPADARTDLYALGAVLYEMATGQRPFPETHGTRLIDSILHQEPQPPSTLNRRVSPALESIILKALDKEPGLRYQSARELQVDLERIALPVSSGRAPRRRRLRLRWPVAAATALALVVLVSLAVYFYFFAHGRAIDSLAVLPFTNASDNPDMEYLSDGITESLTNSLAKLRGLRVVSRSSAFRYKDRNVDPRTAAKELRVRAIVGGRVLQRGDTLVVGAELEDVVRDSHLWGEQYTRKFADIFALQEDITRDISRQLRIQLTGEEERRLTRRGTQNTEAYQLYLKGRYQLNLGNKDSFTKSLDYFNQAVATDPNYALAFSGIADSYYFASNLWLPPRAAMPKAKVAAMKALELDDSLAEAHASLAMVKATYDWDWPGGEREFKRAIELNPNYAAAHLGYGNQLMAMGRFDEAIAEMNQAQQLDPLSPFVAAYSFFPLYMARRYDQAESRLRSVLQTDPNYFLPHAFLGLVYEQTGKLPEAISEFEQASRSEEAPLEALAQLGHAYALAGHRDDAKKVLETVQTQSKTRYLSPYNIALIYLALGEKEKALEWLGKAPEDKSEWFAMAKVDPRLDSLRSDPRFQDFLRRVGLTP